MQNITSNFPRKKVSQTIFRFCENVKIPAYVQVSGSKVIGHLIDSLVTSAWNFQPLFSHVGAIGGIIAALCLHICIPWIICAILQEHHHDENDQPPSVLIGIIYTIWWYQTIDCLLCFVVAVEILRFLIRWGCSLQESFQRTWCPLLNCLLFPDTLLPECINCPIWQYLYLRPWLPIIDIIEIIFISVYFYFGSKLAQKDFNKVLQLFIFFQ